MAFRVPKAKSSPIANCMVQLVGVTLEGGPTAHCSKCQKPHKVRIKKQLQYGTNKKVLQDENKIDDYCWTTCMKFKLLKSILQQ